MTIGELLDAPKILEGSSRRKPKAQPGYHDLDFEVTSSTSGKFVVFIRVNAALIESFSIGLRWVGEDVGGLILLRLNGDHGGHANPDGSRFEEGAHLHAPAAEERQLEACAGFEPRFATLVPECSMLSAAWERFCEYAGVTSHPRLDALVRQIQASGAQLDWMESLS